MRGGMWQIRRRWWEHEQWGQIEIVEIDWGSPQSWLVSVVVVVLFVLLADTDQVLTLARSVVANLTVTCLFLGLSLISTLLYAFMSLALVVLTSCLWRHMSQMMSAACQHNSPSSTWMVVIQAGGACVQLIRCLDKFSMIKQSVCAMLGSLVTQSLTSLFVPHTVIWWFCGYVCENGFVTCNAHSWETDCK